MFPGERYKVEKVRITLIDYGAGNLPSVERALQHLGAATERATTPEAIAAAKVLVLPGVGHFDRLMHTLEAQRLAEPARQALARDVPFLGICLGMQALYEGSDESGDRPGFGIFRGRAQELPRTVRLPHMVWNLLEHLNAVRLLRDVSPKAWFYFAHTHGVAAGNLASSGRVIAMRPAAPRATETPEGATAVCHYGRPFIAVAERGNVFGVQFHPEKSGEAGMDVLRNFLGAIR